jgi:hypothetical protein
MFNRGEIMTEEERLILVHWVENDFKSELVPMIFGKYTNVMTRDNTKIIPLVWEIKKRIILKEGLKYCEQKQFLGDFLAYMPKDSYIQPHRDNIEDEKGMNHSRFNVFIQLAPVKTFYGGVEIDAVERCYVLCRSSRDYHYTEINTTDIPRISLSFGFLLTNEKLDALCRGMPYNSILSQRRMFNRGNLLTDEERIYIRDAITSKTFDVDCKLIKDMIHSLLTKEDIIEYIDFAKVSFLVLEEGQYVEKHVDESRNTVRFDIWIQCTESVYTYYSDIPVKAIEGSYSLCRAGIDTNWCSHNECKTPFIKLSVTLSLPFQVTDKLTSNFNIDMYMNYPLAS